MGKLGSLAGRALGGPLKALIPKNPWLRLVLFAVPVLLVLALLEPVLRLFEKGADLIVRLFVPLLETSGGRLLLLNMVLLFLGALAFLLLRSRIRNLRSGLLLRRHMDGIGNLLDDQRRRAREGFRRVARSRAQPPTEFPPIAQDAKIKLARLAMADGDVDRAVHWLTRVRESQLPKELKRSLAQLRAEAFLAQGEVLPQAIGHQSPCGLGRFEQRRNGDHAQKYQHQNIQSVEGV